MTTPTDKPTFGTQEPLALGETLRQLGAQTLALLIGLRVVHLTEAQTGLVLAEFGVLSLAITAIARSIVTPSSRVALTKKQAELIEAVTPPPPPIPDTPAGATP